MRSCNRCGSQGPFGKNKSSPDGLYSLCKKCRAETAKQRRSRPDVIDREKARLANRYLDLREELLMKRRDRYLANKSETLEKNKQWSDSNREKHRSLNRQWAKTNREASRALVARRRARIKNAPGAGVTADDIKNLVLRSGDRCRCGALFSDVGYHIDHVEPLALGGAHDVSNLQLLCPTCNRKKGARRDEERKQVHP